MSFHLLDPSVTNGFPTWKIPKSLMQDQYKLISLCCCCCCCCCIDLPSRRCRYFRCIIDDVDVEIPNPMRIQRGKLLGCKAWRMLWLPQKLPPRKAALFQNNGLSQEFKYIQVMREPLAVASCCQVRNSNILSCGQRAAQGLTLVIHGESKCLRSSIQSVCVALDPSSGLGSMDKWPIRLQANHSLTG